MYFILTALCWHAICLSNWKQTGGHSSLRYHTRTCTTAVLKNRVGYKFTGVSKRLRGCTCIFMYWERRWSQYQVVMEMERQVMVQSPAAVAAIVIPGCHIGSEDHGQGAVSSLVMAEAGHIGICAVKPFCPDQGRIGFFLCSHQKRKGSWMVLFTHRHRRQT